MSETMKVRITFLEDVLGMANANPDIFQDHIASKAPTEENKEEEIAAVSVEDEIDKKQTIFPRDENGNPIFWDYQIKGFFKDACGMLRYVEKTLSKKMTAYKKRIDGLIFIEERKIPIHFEGQIGKLERPLRASTPQGERIALASSETIPAGATIEFTITCLADGIMDTVREWLDYGKLRGMGQWRNASWGRFTWEDITDEEQ